MDGLVYVPFNKLVLTFVCGFCVAADLCDSCEAAQLRAELLNSWQKPSISIEVGGFSLNNGCTYMPDVI